MFHFSRNLLYFHGKNVDFFPAFWDPSCIFTVALRIMKQENCILLLKRFLANSLGLQLKEVL